MTQSSLAAYSDSELLSMRVKDLPLKASPLPYPRSDEEICSKLKRRGIKWAPDIWPSDEWFSPDGKAGFAFPFTLLDERLVALEKKLIGFCEGSTEREFEKLINHECAHALDNAYALRKHPLRTEVFGDSNGPYPRSYLPLPHSKKYVRHLPGNYAQAHPEEDWAETFAVWLGTKSKWRERYRNWPALDKLKACDQIIREIRNKAPVSKGRGRPLHYSKDERTLREYFAWKRREFGLNRRSFFSRPAKSAFAKTGNQKALEVIKQNEKELTRSLVFVAGLKTYEARHMIRDLKSECRKKNYSLQSPAQGLKKSSEFYVASAPTYAEKGKRRIYM